jgi:hypothetical protein
MKIRTIGPSEAPQWEQYVMSSPRTIAWHAYRWSEAVSATYPGTEFFPLVAEEDGRFLGVLPLYRVRTAPTQLISVAYAVAGGIAADTDESARELLNAAIELSSKLGATRITLKQYRYPVNGMLTTDDNYFNRELSLSIGASRIWDQLSPVNRQAIEAAEAHEVDLDYPSRQVDVFYEFLLRFMTRAGVPCPSKKWVQALLDQDMYAIAFLRVDGKLMAATMAKAFKKTVSFPFTCMRDQSLAASQATYALYWRLIEYFAGQGYEIAHSGRMPNSEDVSAYRLGWGGTKHPYYYQYYPQSQTTTEYRTKRGWKRDVFTACWKRMPTQLTGVIGPRIAARFP